MAAMLSEVAPSRSSILPLLADALVSRLLLYIQKRESKRETCRLRRSNGAGGPPHCEIRTEVDLPLSRRIRECSLLLSVTQNKQTRWERPKLDEFTTSGV